MFIFHVFFCKFDTPTQFLQFHRNFHILELLSNDFLIAFRFFRRLPHGLCDIHQQYLFLFNSHSVKQSHVWSLHIKRLHNGFLTTVIMRHWLGV